MSQGATEMEIWLVALVILNFLFTSYLWQQARRGPRQKFRRSLGCGGPITPKHARSADLKEGWGVTGEDLQFFEDFDLFGDVLNRTMNDEPWRVQEMSETEISGIRDYPLYGRRYEIFYNQHKLGTLQVHASHPYSASEPIVRTEIELDFARLIPFESILGFVSFVAMFTASSSREEWTRLHLALSAPPSMSYGKLSMTPSLMTEAAAGISNFSFTGRPKTT